MIQIVACFRMPGVAFKHPFVCRDCLFECGNRGFVIAQGNRLLGDLRHCIGMIVGGVDAQGFVTACLRSLEGIAGGRKELDRAFRILQRRGVVAFFVIRTAKTVVDDLVLGMLELQAPDHLAGPFKISAVQ